MHRRLLPLLLLAISVAAPPAASAPVHGGHGAPTHNMDVLANVNEYPLPAGGQKWAYSSCWAYVHGDGREYALLGVSNGTAVYNVSDPESPYRVGFIPGPVSIWREMKSYREWVYIVTEGTGTGRGVQVVRMSDPEQPQLVTTWTGSFIRSHTVSVDTTRALLVCSGTWNADGAQTGVRVLSLANPEAPVEIGWWPGTRVPFADSLYVHDTHLDGERWWMSSIGAGLLRLADGLDPARPTETWRFGYPLARTHSTTTDASGRFVYACNEDNGLPVSIIDTAAPGGPSVVGGFTSNPVAIMHNPRRLGNELWLSAYTEGVRVWDLTDPVRPAECAWADTYAGPSGGYNGVWEVCAELPSGTIVASDMTTGLWLMRPRREHAFVWLRVLEAENSAPLADVHMETADGPEHAHSAADGWATLAPLGGTRMLRATRFGFRPESTEVTLAPGGRDTVHLRLRRLPFIAVEGTVRDAVTGAPVPGAHIEFEDAPLHTHASAAGQWRLSYVPVQPYDVKVTAPGYSAKRLRWNAPTYSTVLELDLTPVAWWETFESGAAGWTVGAAGDDATSGQWTRVIPRGTGPRPAAAQGGPRTTSSAWRRPGAEPAHEEHELPTQGNAAPYTDSTPDPGAFCFVTGQGTDSTRWDEADVDGGRTTLTSPAWSLAGMTRPVLSFWRWFHSYDAVDTEQPDGADHLAVLVSDEDGPWVSADTLRGEQNRWAETRLDLAALLPGAASVRLRLVAADLGVASTVEAGVDDIALADEPAAPLAADPWGRTLAMSAANPNPSRRGTSFEVQLLRSDPRARFEVLDAAGRIVHARWESLAAGAHRLSWDLRDSRGARVPPGLYLARLAAGGGEQVRRVLVVR